MKYVDDIKRALGGCAHLGCPGGEGPKDAINNHPQCFDFDHIVEADKASAISEIVQSLKKVPVAGEKKKKK
jgi:hypothetical protein